MIFQKYKDSQGNFCQSRKPWN